MLLFDFAGKLGLLLCFRCFKPIESVDQFSIEHKIAWLGTDDPIKYFFDLDNISFSHPDCNSRAAFRGGVRGPNKSRKEGEFGSAWCSHHQAYLDISLFSKNRRQWNGLQDICMECRSKYRSPK
jgi:hypothetical protein